MFDYLKKEIITKENQEKIIDKLSNTFYEVYAFYEISKNPPNFDNKVDIKKELKKIKTEKRPFYEFYQDLLKVISRLRDGHTRLLFRNSILFKQRIAFYNPISLEIKNNSKNETKVYGKLYLNDTYMKSFKKYTNKNEIKDVIINNSNVAIKRINGKNPFEYIDNFGKEFFDIRNIHGAFTYRFNSINKLPLAFLPLYYENLTNFTVEYENNQSFVTDYILMTTKNDITQNDSNSNNIKKNFLDIDINITNKENENNEIIFIPEIIDFPHEFINLNKLGLINLQKENLSKDKKTPTLEWKYKLPDVLKCRVDSVNNVNVFFMESFIPEEKDYNEFFQIMSDCAKLFDENKYKIIIIFNMNGGGLVSASQFLLELFSQININIYSALRITDTLKKNYYMPFFSLDKCEPINFRDYFQNHTEVEYNNNIKDNLTNPYNFMGKEIRNLMRKFKPKLKNKRSPTDILVYTDGFSFSATSIFLKYFQHYGLGITVGYFGNPNKNDVFDSSLSPSAIALTEDLVHYSPYNFKKLNKDYNLGMNLALHQLFYDPYNLSVPLEYDVTPVDERVPIYQNFSDLNYDLFIQKAKEIFSKYQTKCNINNKKLFLLDEKCKNISSKDEHLHGGYICGDNGEWNKNTCVPTYCDEGYILDPIKNKCFYDYCSEIDIYWILVNIFIFLSLIILLVFMIYLCIRCCRSSKRKKTKINTNISEGVYALHYD